MKLESFFTSIANKMRELLGTTDKIKPKNFVNKLTEIFNAGKKSAYDAFWDNYQQNGNRRDYYCAFSGKGWTTDNFKPKYDIIIDGSSDSNIYFFDRNLVSGSLKQILKNQGVELKLQNLGNAYKVVRLFYNNSGITELPTIDFSSITTGSLSSYTISWLSGLQTVEKFIFPNSSSVTLTLFGHCSKLTNIVFEGTCLNSFNFDTNGAVSADSIKNLFEHLDTTATTTNRTITLNKKTKTAYTQVYNDWDTKVAYYSTNGNWTFSIV